MLSISPDWRVIMANVSNPAVALPVGEVQPAARTFGLEVAISEVRRAEDIASAFDALKGRADALYVCADPLTYTNRIRINTLALGMRRQPCTVFGSTSKREA